MGADATLAAKLSLNIDGLKKGWADAETASAAATGRMSAAQKQAASAATKAAKESADAAAEFKSQAAGIAGEFVNARSATDLLAKGAQMLGEHLKLGAAGAVGVAVISGILGKVDELVTEAEKMKAALDAALSPKGGSASYSLGEIQNQMQKTLEVAGELQTQLKHTTTSSLGDVVSTTARRLTSGDLGEVKDGLLLKGQGSTIFGDGAAKKREGELKQLSAAAQDSTDNATEKMRDLAGIEETRIALGEKAASLAQIQLELNEKIGAAVRDRIEAERNGLSIDTTGKQREAHRQAEARTANVERVENEAARGAQDSHESAYGKQSEGTTALRSKVKAAQDEIVRLQAEYEKKVSYSNETKDPGKKRAINAEVDQVDIERRNAVVKLAELQADLSEKQVDLDRAREQSQINIVALGGKELGTKAQIDLLNKMMADNEERMGRADEDRKLSLQGQNVALKEQIASLAMADTLRKESVRDASEGIERARVQAAIETVAQTSKVQAAEAAIALLHKEASVKRQHAKDTPDVDKKRAYNNEADQLDTQAYSESIKLLELRRGLMEKEVDLSRAREQSQVNLLSLTGQDVQGRAQIVLWQKEILDNNRRLKTADESGRIELEKQNATLAEQIRQQQILEALKTPKAKAAERAAARRGVRAEHLVDAKARDQEHTEKLGGQRHRLGDAMIAKQSRKKGGDQTVKTLEEAQAKAAMLTIAAQQKLMTGLLMGGALQQLPPDPIISGKNVGAEIAKAVTDALGKAQVVVKNL